MNERRLRSALVHANERLFALGLNRGTSGNVSARCGNGFLITPSGAGAGVSDDDLVYVTMSGVAQGRLEPSSEWLLHRDLLAARPEFDAVVHTHSVAATALACLRTDMPPFHYLVARLGGDSVRCATYATFGTQQLADHAVHAIRERKACLLANHGMVAAGADLDEALALASEVETLSEIYLRSLSAGPPVLLTDDELKAAQDRFASYGVREAIG